MTCPSDYDCFSSEITSKIFAADLGLALALLAFLVAAKPMSGASRLATTMFVAWSASTLLSFAILPSYFWEKGSDAIAAMILAIFCAVLLVGAITFTAVIAIGSSQTPWRKLVLIPMGLVPFLAVAAVVLVPVKNAGIMVGRLSAIGMVGLSVLIVVVVALWPKIKALF